ncbi:MAG: hypothetical protein ACP5K8_02790 [Nitrososphaeria archaeon]
MKGLSPSLAYNKIIAIQFISRKVIIFVGDTVNGKFMVENLPGEVEENVYILEDKIVVTVFYRDVYYGRILPNEWIIVFDRKEVLDVKYEGNLLILFTKDGGKVKVCQRDAKDLYFRIRGWLKDF